MAMAMKMKTKTKMGMEMKTERGSALGLIRRRPAAILARETWRLTMTAIAWMTTAFLLSAPPAGSELEQLKYNNLGLVVDLGVGLWAQPLPMDFDGDGDNDLLVATADVPYNGLYFFENADGDVPYPVFKPGVRLDRAMHNITCSYLGDGVLVQTPNQVYPDFRDSLFGKPAPIPYKPSFHQGRAKQWKRYDYDGDGVIDLVLGVSDWREYGWDNAYNAQGEWTRGLLHGHVYFIRNTGTNDGPAYAEAVQLQAGGQPLDVYGCPSPNFYDWDGDGDLDLVCGEFMDGLTYFENVGSRSEPQYAEGRFLEHEGATIRMDLQMLQVVAFDWDADGDADLVVGQEDGRVALLENVGALVQSTPAFLPPRFFQQQADAVKVGALCTPYGFDWDGDGDEDLIVGDTAGYISFVENLDGGVPPKWAPPAYLETDGETIRIQAGPNGSIQGPCEAKWGYTVLSVADWDHDGLPDGVIISIWGEVLWYRNAGTRTVAQLEAARPIEVAWGGPPPKPEWFWWNPKGSQLVTQWRTSPVVIDLNEDGLNDLVMLDHEGYLALFERRRAGEGLELLPGKRIFLNEDGVPLRLNEKAAGKSGRRKLALTDWDGDGRLDILINSKCIDFLRNVGTDDQPYVFHNEGPVHARRLAGHTTSPAIVDWDRNGIPDLVIGAEDGFLYYLKNPRA